MAFSGFREQFKHTWCGAVILGVVQIASATPNLQGQTGYINMPSAQVEADGTVGFGYSYDSPYATFWASATVLPFFQATGRYVAINGIPGFSSVRGEYGSQYGRYKDKVFDLKLRILEETDWLPAVAAGATDLMGTELFKGQYLVATKRFGAAKNLEASIGVGRRRPEGVFGGVRYTPTFAPRWSVVAEYDANNYSKDYKAELTDAGKRSKGASVALEYRWGWLGAQVAKHRDHLSANAYINIPFSEREFVPKLYEPRYFDPKNAPARVAVADWKAGEQGVALKHALAKQDFKNIRVDFDGATLKLSLTNSRISNLGRAIGRAARTALAFAPEGARSITVTYTRLEQPIATFEFLDLGRLSDYFSGLSDRETFLQSVIVRYSRPGDQGAGDQQGMLAALDAKEDALQVHVGRDGDLVQLRSEDQEANSFKTVPKLAFFFNDPSGALRYEVAAGTTYDRRLREGLYLNAALRLDLFENVSKVTQPSNSLLPHVRTDVAEYKRGGRFKLNRLLLNQYLTLDERLYARVSGGFYEEMYRGVGGQVLYLPRASHWATDLTVDALQQRGVKGWLDKRDYKTVTALAALHYQLPYEVTATARVGRFLARDNGVRVELKRRFQSGVEIGAWYTRTDIKDTTAPGTLANPYNDKGIFLSVPLNIMLPADTKANAGISLSPWTRDVGQMVASPGDLYDLFEQPRRDMTAYDGLGNFAERRDEQNLPAVNPPVRPMPAMWPLFRWRLEQSFSNTPTLPQWAKGTVLGGGAILGAALLDKPVDRFMEKHAGSSVARAWDKVGKDTPVVLVGAAAGALAFGDARVQNMGIISLESIAGAAAVSMATKRIVGRARPSEGTGAWSKTANRSDASFPSNHSTVAFAAVTPFAQEYDAPWLYGLVAASSLGRTAGREHWVSDVVAGGVIGYAMGSWLWQTQRTNTSSSFAVAPGPKSLSVSWSGTY